MIYATDKNLNIVGTCFQGYAKVTYQRLVKLFGEPCCCDDYKVDAEWRVKDNEGRIFTIYNYKNGKNYCGRCGTPTEKITKWHIGGHGTNGVENLISFIETEKKI